MNISIRHAEASDLETVQKFGSELLNYERKAFDSSLDENWAFSDEAKKKYLAAINEKYVIIAEKDGHAIGFLIGSIISPKAGDARPIKQGFLQNIYVDEAERKTGIGNELLEDFKKYCIEEGVSRLNVSVLAKNEVAVSFYQKSGFKPRSINLSMELTHSE
ncbi:GNAT family N-acetyltransferase [Candidatus Saccharibacteria bacterium]|nr:GNAT family N-acetyltransferase [Candidatus Saccharibacteria bacterium]